MTKRNAKQASDVENDCWPADPFAEIPLDTFCHRNQLRAAAKNSPNTASGGTGI